MASVQDYVDSCPICGVVFGEDRCSSLLFCTGLRTVWFSCTCGAKVVEGYLFTNGKPSFDICRPTYSSRELADLAWVDGPEVDAPEVNYFEGHAARIVAVFQPSDLPEEKVRILLSKISAHARGEIHRPEEVGGRVGDLAT